MKFAILTIVQFCGIDYIYTIVQSPPLAISKTFSSSQMNLCTH